MSSEPPPYIASSKVEDSESPPSYDSLFGKMKYAKENSSGNVDFAKNCCSVLLGSLACTLCLGIFLAIPISMIAIGAVYLNDCPAERMIPIYLIVAGCFGLVSNLISLIKSVMKKSEEDKEKSQLGLEQIVNVFLFAWFIAGNVWVYRTYDSWQRSESTLTTYCNPTLYYYSFWIITSTYIIVGACCLIGIIFCFVVCCCSAKE